MLRVSLRSVADPIRDYSCLSCLARRYGAPAGVRQFHRAPVLRNNASSSIIENKSGDDVPADSLVNSTDSGSSTVDGELKTEDSGEKKTNSDAQKPKKRNKEKGSAIVKKLIRESMKHRKAARAASDKPQKEKSKLSHVQKYILEKETGEISSENDKITALDYPTAPVPGLSFGLDRTLFNPGVYQLRDPRSRVYNFDPYLSSIMPISEFDFNTLKPYITSSKDEYLRSVAVKEKKKYVGSSSSMTSVLSHFHYLLSTWRAVDIRSLSQGFPETRNTFTRLLRAPAAIFLHHKDGVYSIDADKEFDMANVLMNLGKSMEKLLTMPKEEFERYRRTHKNKITAEEEEAIPESYHYSTYGDFIMRSQLDAYDPRLPGTGMFDLKTRAVVSIRMEAQNVENGMGYEIKTRFGNFESYEREFYDMIRSAFLKYSLQVRIGRMDGIFVAFHNIERIFGFQYISLPEMDQALHGQEDTALGDTEFQLSVGLWNKILDRATKKFPEQSLRIHFETREAVTPFMYIFVEPVSPEQIDAIQNKNKAEIEAIQNRLLNLKPEENDSDLNEESDSESSEPIIEASEPETSAHPESISEPTAESIIESTPAPAADETEGKETEEETNERPLLAIALTIKNKINDKYVQQVVNFGPKDKWAVEYEINDLLPSHGRALYKMCQTRRHIALKGGDEDEASENANNIFFRRLREISKRGRNHRKRENKLDKELGIIEYKEKR
ncbi:mitochondrial translation protein [Penicillium taxi]|uniref:mitochondrial translation protein n=1 Tax=Penicillium taxi TaxID=168475 RepID=UPI0025452C24|nr:mitochondrial translation protein [Penicillium taxi]KAJ5902502.1 mitochondrial translation protein [Penicillium taxi]